MCVVFAAGFCVTLSFNFIDDQCHYVSDGPVTFVASYELGLEHLLQIRMAIKQLTGLLPHAFQQIIKLWIVFTIRPSGIIAPIDQKLINFHKFLRLTTEPVTALL